MAKRVADLLVDVLQSQSSVLTRLAGRVVVISRFHQ
jgi:hypothetical protein